MRLQFWLFWLIFSDFWQALALTSDNLEIKHELRIPIRSDHIFIMSRFKLSSDGFQNEILTLSSHDHIFIEHNCNILTLSGTTLRRFFSTFVVIFCLLQLGLSVKSVFFDDKILKKQFFISKESSS